MPHCVRFQLLTLKNESKSIGRDTRIPKPRMQAKPGAQGEGGGGGGGGGAGGEGGGGGGGRCVLLKG